MMIRITPLTADLSAGALEAAVAVALTGCLLVLRHLLSSARVAALLGAGDAGAGDAGAGPFRWPLHGPPRMVAAHRLLVAALLGAPAAGAALILFGPRGVVALAAGGNRVAVALGLGALAGAALAALMAVLSRRADLCDRYPAMRPARWTLGVALLDAGTWAIYLAVYEFLLRGLLLGVLMAAVGPLAALVTTVLIDALAHVPQGRPETLGSAFSAALFAVLVLATGGIIAPLIAHLAMALSVDLWCARAALCTGP